MIYQYQCSGCRQNFYYDANYDGFNCAACGKKLIRKDNPIMLGLKLINKVNTMKKALFAFIKNITFAIPLFMLTGCAGIPSFLQTAEDIIDDDAITIKVSREALGRNTNIIARVELDNGQVQK
jgi:DNA-directed RNA polymerase subunit RPC12/RpoP